MAGHADGVESAVAASDTAVIATPVVTVKLTCSDPTRSAVTDTAPIGTRNAAAMSLTRAAVNAARFADRSSPYAVPNSTANSATTVVIPDGGGAAVVDCADGIVALGVICVGPTADVVALN